MANAWSDFTKYSGWGDIMNMLYPNYTNPANAGMPYLNSMGNKADTAYSPYMNTGTNALNQYYNNASAWSTPQGAMNNYNTIAAGYTQSPWTQYQNQNALDYSNQAAAASGMAGTPSEQAAVANQVYGITSQGENQYMNDVMRTQQQGQQGLGDVSQMGLQATNQDINDWMKQYGAQAMMAYMGQMNQNAANKQPNFISSAFSGLF